MNFFKIKKNKIPFGKPLIDNNEIKSVTNVLKSGIYAHGPRSSLFEKKFCNFTGAKYSSTVSSCTAGMHLFYFALGIGNSSCANTYCNSSCSRISRSKTSFCGL